MRVHALGVHIQGHRYDIQVAGAFPVAEQTAFDAFRSGQQAQFRAGYARTSVIMGMQADDGRFPVGQMLDKIFNLVRIGIGGTHLHRSRQIDDDRFFFCSSQRVHHFMADAYGKVLFRSRIAFRGIFITDVHAAAGHFLFRQLADQLCALHGDVHDAIHIFLEDDLALQGGGGIIKMNDYVFRALDRLKGLLDQLRPGLYQHLQVHVVRHQILFDEGTDNFIFRFRSRRKPDFNFFKADIDQRTEHAQLFMELHGRYQCLVAVPQVHAAPDGRLINNMIRPVTVFQRNLCKRDILLQRCFHCLLLFSSPYIIKKQ